MPPREEELRGQRFLRVQEDRSGMLHLTGAFDPEHGAAIMVAHSHEHYPDAHHRHPH